MTGSRRPLAECSIERTRLQRAVLTTGVGFILLGLAGFVMGLTWSFGELRWAGPESRAMLLGIFQTSVLHNLLHLGYGAVGLAAAAGRGASRRYLEWGGAAFLALVVQGLVTPQDSSANVLPANGADDLLNLAVGVGLLLLRFTPGRQGGQGDTPVFDGAATGRRRTRVGR